MDRCNELCTKEATGTCEVCEAWEERDRLLGRLLWLVWDFSGLRFISRMIVPPDPSEPPKRPPATFLIWSVGIYAAVFGLTSQRYENRLDRLENRANSIYAQLGADHWRTVLELIPDTQHTLLPVEPDFWNPFSIYYSLVGEREVNRDIVKALQRVIISFATAKPKKDLAGVNLTEVDLSGASLWEADLSGASLVRADLRGAILHWANLSETNLWEADLRGAHLCGTNLSKAQLHKADLRGAHLRGADLSKASLSQADLREANLSKADLSEATLRRAKLRGAILYKAKLYKATLREADLREADLSEAQFHRTKFHKPNLHRATLYKAKFYRVDLRGANLRGADLREARLAMVKLGGADLRGADLRGAHSLPQKRLDEACVDKETQLPDNRIRPKPCPDRR